MQGSRRNGRGACVGIGAAQRLCAAACFLYTTITRDCAGIAGRGVRATGAKGGVLSKLSVAACGAAARQRTNRDCERISRSACMCIGQLQLGAVRVIEADGRVITQARCIRDLHGATRNRRVTGVGIRCREGDRAEVAVGRQRTRATDRTCQHCLETTTA